MTSTTKRYTVKKVKAGEELMTLYESKALGPNGSPMIRMVIQGTGSRPFMVWDTKTDQPVHTWDGKLNGKLATSCYNRKYIATQVAEAYNQNGVS